MMSMLTTSSSKSTPNSQKKPALDHRSALLLVSSISILAIAFGIYQLYTIFQQALDVPNADDNSHSNYFNRKVIDELRDINTNQYNIQLPEGRINPFK